LPHDTVTEIIDTLTELKRMHQLNLELLEQLSVSCSWLMEHNVPIPNAETICSLLKKATILLSEIQADQPKILQYKKLADEKKQPFKTDDKETEPAAGGATARLRESGLTFNS
jgi:hypothetical protein